MHVGDATGNAYGLDSLSIDQGRLLVGASGASSGTPQEAQLFDLATGTLLQNFGLPSPGQGFGFAVEVSGPWALIGDPMEDRAYVFDTASGDLVTTLVPPGPPGEIFRFGKDVVIDGNRAAIADHGRNSVFIYDTQTWTLQRTISKTSEFINWFGASIDMEGDNLVVGAMANTAYGPALGGVYVYDLSDGSEVELLPDEYQWHVYGADVAIHGNTVAVGGTAAGWDLYRWGSVGIFDATTGADLARIFPPEPNWATAWGWALDFDEHGRLERISDYRAEYPQCRK
ncbi:MAG: YncE family protein [Pirellulales bacterium]